MSKVWNDEKIYEILIEKRDHQVLPNEDYKIVFKKTFDEKVTINFKTSDDMLFSENPLHLSSKVEAFIVKCKIPGVFSLKIESIEGLDGMYKLLNNASFDIYQSGEIMELVNINCRW